MSSAAHVIDPDFPGIEKDVLDAYRQAPDNMVAEVLDGELSLMPRPRPRHAKAAARITGALRGFYDPNDDEPGGWIVLMEPELHLGNRPHIVDPDLVGWRRERLPEEPAEAAIRLAPDWVDTFEGNVKVRAEPFEAIELDLERIWRW